MNKTNCYRQQLDNKKVLLHLNSIYKKKTTNLALFYVFNIAKH